MKYCTKCGTQVPDDSKFCTKCGNKLNGETIESSSKSRKSMLVGSGAILAVAVVAVLFVTSIMGGKAKAGSKKWEKQYEKRMEAYQGYYAEHMNDWVSVGGLILLDEDSYPYMLLYCQNKESDQYMDMSVIGYEDKEAKVIAGKLNSGGFVPHSGDGYCFFEEGEGEKYYVLKDGDFVELSREDIESSGWRIDDEDEAYFFDTSTSPYSYIGKRMIPDVIAFHGDRISHSEWREPGNLLLGHSDNDSAFEDNDFYLGSKKVDASEFYEVLYGYYDAGNSVCASGTAFYPFSLGYNSGSSFNQVLREISDAKPMSNLELMAFYMGSWDKNTNEDTEGTAPGKVLVEADVASALLKSPVEDWKVRLKCDGAVAYDGFDEDAESSPSFILYDVNGDGIPESFIEDDEEYQRLFRCYSVSGSESVKCHAFSSDGKLLWQDIDRSENQEVAKSTIYQMGKDGVFEEVVSLYCNETDYDHGGVESISCKKDDKDCTYTEYLGEFAKYIDTVGWLDFCTVCSGSSLEDYKKAVDDWKENREVDFKGEDDEFSCIKCDYEVRKVFPEAYEAFDAYMKFMVNDEFEKFSGKFLYLDDDVYPELVSADTLYTYKDGKVTLVEHLYPRYSLYPKTGYFVLEGLTEDGLRWSAYKLNGTEVEESEGVGNFSESGYIKRDTELVSIGYDYVEFTDALHDLLMQDERFYDVEGVGDIRPDATEYDDAGADADAAADADEGAYDD